MWNKILLQSILVIWKVMEGVSRNVLRTKLRRKKRKKAMGSHVLARTKNSNWLQMARPVNQVSG